MEHERDQPASPRADQSVELEGRVDRLAEGAEHLREMSGADLADAWWRATADLVADLPADLGRRMADAAGLSPQGLAAGLEVVVRGVRTDAGRRILRETRPPAGPLRPALVVLASNLPGLALQCLLPALAARRPLLLKTPRGEPDFTPWLLRRLESVDPRLGSADACATWRGGDRAVEDRLLPRVARVIAYGGDGAMRDLGERTSAGAVALVDHGHRFSVGVVLPDAEPGADSFDVDGIARGLARDVALFDQRGCLSVHAVLVERSVAEPLARSLASHLGRLSEELPPGPAAAGRLAAVRAAREEAVMAGHRVFDLPLRHGTVLLADPSTTGSTRLESPGLRTVHVVPVASAEAALEILGVWEGRLQGVALTGARGTAIESGLRNLGVTRTASPGRLQEVDAAVWQNGGRDPLAVYAGDAEFRLG